MSTTESTPTPTHVFPDVGFGVVRLEHVPDDPEGCTWHIIADDRPYDEYFHTAYDTAFTVAERLSRGACCPEDSADLPKDHCGFVTIPLETQS